MSAFVRFIAVFVCLTLGIAADAQSSGPSDPPSTESPNTAPVEPAVSSPQAPIHSTSLGDGHRVGFGVKGSLLGGGFEIATPVTHRTNVRAGFNIFSYGRTFHKDDITYDGQLSFKTFEAHYDFFPWAKSFHVSGGLLTYIGDPITANAGVAGGQAFSLGGTNYYSDPAAPVTGKGKINFNRAAPTLTFGWGNLVPRGEGSHFSVPVELGVAFQGSPKATLNLSGNVCDSPGTNCRSIASDSTVQSQILSEQSKLNNSMSFFKVYPIISVGFGYKF